MKPRTIAASPFVRLPWRGGSWDRVMLQWCAPDRSDWGLLRHRIVRERNLRFGPLTLTWWRLAMTAELASPVTHRSAKPGTRGGDEPPGGKP